MASTEPISGTRPAWATKDREGARDEMTPAAEAAPAPSEELRESAVPTGTVHAGATAPRGGRFIEELMRAMLATATESKADAIDQARADAKAYTEAVHDRSSEDSAGLRQAADGDISSIRDWSKAEMARVREETDRRIATRKDELAVELEAHAGRIEQEIDQVQQRVAKFEADMDVFLADLAACPDPTTMASLAEQMPEPPRFTSQALSDEELDQAEAVTTDGTVTAEEPGISEAAPVAVEVGPPEEVAEVEAAEALVEAEAVAPQAIDSPAEPGLAVVDAEAPGEPAGDQAVESEAIATAETEPATAEAQPATIEAVDAVPESITPEDPAEAALAARLSQLTPSHAPDALEAAAAEAVPVPITGTPVKTRVSVVGLVSVSGIAAFKRNLARLPGVMSVGVSSSPDGAFVFNVSHDPGLSLEEVIPALPGFGARVSQVGEGTLGVTARDPGQE